MAADLLLVKSAIPTVGDLGDKIVYTIKISNTGLDDTTIAVIKDSLNPNLQYANNLLVDGAPSAGDITQGIDIGVVIAGGAARTIQFDALIINGPSNQQIPNQATAEYEYDENGLVFTGSSVSNTLIITAVVPNMTIEKGADKGIVEVGDSFIYTIRIENTGNDDADVILTDVLPPQFKVEEITVDEHPVTGDLATGLDLGTIIVDQVVVVKVKIIVVDSFNSQVPYINTATIDISYAGGTTDTLEAKDPIGVVVIDPKLRLQKISDVDQAIVGDIITYTITATNEGDVDLEKVIIKDTLDPGIEFIEGSVVVDDMPRPLESILAGVDVGPLLIGQSKKLIFKAKIVTKTADEMCNQATAVYCYRLTPDGLLQWGEQLSNINCILVQVANIEIEKVADRKEASLNDLIGYTVVIRNTGDTKASNVIFTDQLPDSLELLPESVMVNGAQVITNELAKGINVGDIPSGGSVTIKYKAKVVGGSCNGKVCNEAQVFYKYVLPNGTAGFKESNIASVCICLNIAVFRQLALSKFCPVPGHKPSIEEVNDVLVEATVVDAYVVKTQQGISNEGQNLSGYKLVVNGRFEISIEYTADLECQPIHAYHCDFPFGTFVILPPDYKMGDEVSVDIKIEDVDAEMINCRGISANIIYMVVAKVH